MILQPICSSFNITDVQSCQPLVSGLINNSYKVSSLNGDSYFLQRVNTAVFNNPLALQRNYLQVQQHLLQEGDMQLPKLIRTTTGDLFYDKDGEVWRCFEYLNNTYSPQVIETPEKAYEVANCFGSFTAALQSLDKCKIETIIPDFHNLHLRFQQFEQAVQAAPAEKKEDVQYLIKGLEKYTPLVTWYKAAGNNEKAYPLHIMHHDCKIANILFNKDTDAIRCPIDLDTTQPGLFFSDIGDMIRTTVPNVHEDGINLNELTVRPDFYHAITAGYLDAMARFLTKEERDSLHYAGSIMIYMQALRFLADHLNGDIYYRTAYPGQNKDRAANQVLLLDLLHQFTAGKKNNFA